MLAQIQHYVTAFLSNLDIELSLEMVVIIIAIATGILKKSIRIIFTGIFVVVAVYFILIFLEMNFDYRSVVEWLKTAFYETRNL